jgi:hypothetical protein
MEMTSSRDISITNFLHATSVKTIEYNSSKQIKVIGYPSNNTWNLFSNSLMSLAEVTWVGKNYKKRSKKWDTTYMGYELSFRPFYKNA